MSASLVGSEMCIRDRHQAPHAEDPPPAVPSAPCGPCGSSPEGASPSSPVTSLPSACASPAHRHSL
eukprot:5836660-Alexandrium_andersonii.AAC.1